jgi:hypothetical protein
MKYRVISECVVDARDEKDAQSTVTTLLDDGMVSGIVMVSAEECEPTQRELEHASWWSA